MTVDLKQGKAKAACGIFLFFVFSFFFLSEPSSTSTSTYDTPDMFYGEMWNYTANLSAWDFEFFEGVGVYHNLSNLSIGHLRGFTFTAVDSAHGGSYLTTTKEGLYKITLSSSFSAEGKGLYSIMVARNFDKDTARECYSRRTISTPDSVGSISNSCLLSFEVGDTVNILVEDEVSPLKHIHFHTVNLDLIRVGDIP